MTEPSVQGAEAKPASPLIEQGEQGEQAAAKGRAQRVRAWVKRIGFWGCVFFTLKGLSWLIIPVIIARCFGG